MFQSSSKRSAFVVLLIGCFHFNLISSWAGGFEGPGVGAKALSMGGAFVGLADDWTAVYWNPSGLAQLKGSGVGFDVNQIFSKTVDTGSMDNPFPPYNHQNVERGDTFINLGGEPTHFNETSDQMSIPIPGLGAYHRWGNWVGAVSVVTPLGFSSDIKDNSVPNLAASFKSQAEIFMSGISLATTCSSWLQLGAGVHILTARLNRDAAKSSPGYLFQANSSASDNAEPEGVVGALIKPSRYWQLGLVYRTASTMHLSGSSSVSDSRFPIPTPSGTLQNENSRFVSDLYDPATYGAGFAFFPLPRWTVTADWQGTDWRPERNKITFDHPGLILQNQDFNAGWKFTNRIRVGTEVQLSKRWSWRAGFFNDPQAQPDNAQSQTYIIDTTRRFVTTGATIAWETVNLDLGYMYGWGHESIQGIDFSRPSHSLLLDVTYHFHNL